MRVVVVAETFAPAVNGVVGSVRHVAAELSALGHRVLVVAPSGEAFRTPGGALVEVVRVPSLRLPGYRELDLARPRLDLVATLRSLDPDVVHLASPALLGDAAVRAARSLDVPTVAVFQTDLAAYACRYRVPGGSTAAWRWLRAIHNRADLTLAPSTAAVAQLRRHGIGPVALWGRGVDGALFHPRRRDAALRSRLLAGRTLLVGAVGRLAAEKRLDRLAAVAQVPGVRLVLIGDGPRRAALRAALPDATFTGRLHGEHLAAHVASLDLLVHPGADETFGQVVQEALAAGVPAVVAASGGPLDLVRHGHNGLLWAGDDGRLLAAHVATLAEDRAELARLAGHARASVAGRTWARLGAELVGHYRQVLGADAAPPLALPRTG